MVRLIPQLAAISPHRLMNKLTAASLSSVIAIPFRIY
jgi:hypothetical protein